MLSYGKVAEILSSTLFDNEPASLLKSLAANPERFIGLFRYTSTEGKLMQFIFQSREIKFGYALEKIVDHVIFDIYGWQILDKNLTNELSCDHLGMRDDIILMIEQKIRDDHDSTKKRGQFTNFERKAEYIILNRKKYKAKRFVFIMYFIDSSMDKNKAYYQKEIKKMRDYYNHFGYNFDVLYGEELFLLIDGLAGIKIGREVWKNLIQHIQTWKKTLPSLPDLSLDTDTAKPDIETLSYNEPTIWRKIAENDALWKGGVIDVLFPTKENLNLALTKLHEKVKESPVYKRAWEALYRRLNPQNTK